MTRYLPHIEPCATCAASLLFLHCDACHRLFLHCAGCEQTSADVRRPGHEAQRLPPGEHPVCPRCNGTRVRPATRSDLQNRDMLTLAQLEDT